MPSVGRHRQSSRMLGLTPVSLQPVGPLPLPLVYPPSIAQMVSYWRILRDDLFGIVLWSLCGNRGLAGEEPFGFHLNRCLNAKSLRREPVVGSLLRKVALFGRLNRGKHDENESSDGPGSGLCAGQRLRGDHKANW